ncbi:hypothetical protein [Pseudomonas protegens]|uniref:hypothetical protein n=1 Tax=Pseudomonas protegens TaxID=380021 RepID=UPI0035672774
MKLPENIENALGYSPSDATAKSNIGNTEKEHIPGLANLLERTTAEAEAMRKDAQHQRSLGRNVIPSRHPPPRQPSADYAMPPLAGQRVIESFTAAA